MADLLFDESRQTNQTQRQSWTTDRSRVAALAIGILGGVVLLGWLFEVETIKRILPGYTAMNPVTAIAFLLSAACLWFVANSARHSSPAVFQICAALLLLIGVTKLAGMALGVDTSIDRWLFPQKLAAESMAPNRMAPNDAFNFLLLGASFFFLQARNPRVSVWACILALVAGFEALLAVLGYAYNIRSLSGVGTLMPMALHSGVGFLIVAYGIMSRQAARGFLGIITGRNAGGAMARRLLPAAILVPAGLGWLRIEGQRAGFYDAEFGVALSVITNMVVFGSVICCNALSLFRSDTQRTRAERRLRRAHDELERRVAERTAALLTANAALVEARDELETRVAQRTATLAESESRLHAILDNGTSIVYLKDLKGRYILVNKAFEALLGRPKWEIINRTAFDLFPREAAEQFQESDLQALAMSQPMETEEFAEQEDGVHTFISTKFPLRDSAGEIYALCGIAHDITERAQAHEAQRAAEIEANRANRAKSEFLSRMSHELRTPMNAILGFAQLLELDELNDSQRDGVTHILRGGRHLLDLINEVLDISRIEAGQLSLSPEPVEMADVLRETLNLVQPLATARDVRLNPAPVCASFVRADRQRLKQVVINLLSNAIKYNRLGGSVTVVCECTGTHGRISVADTGIGIPTERLEQLFVPFQRLGAEQSAVEGTGLGLAVAKRLTEAMEGHMGVESSPGQGSTFWIEFPLAESPLVERESVIDPVVIASETPRLSETVLYIEDNLSNLRLIERLIERRPHINLVAAAEGLAGLNMAREHRPDLILLDVNLPDMDGHEVLVRLRGDPACAHIPVVVISADATRGQIERLKNAGAAAYLTKPLDVPKFLDVLDRALAATA